MVKYCKDKTDEEIKDALEKSKEMDREDYRKKHENKIGLGLDLSCKYCRELFPTKDHLRNHLMMCPIGIEGGYIKKGFVIPSKKDEKIKIINVWNEVIGLILENMRFVVNNIEPFKQGKLLLHSVNILIKIYKELEING